MNCVWVFVELIICYKVPQFGRFRLKIGYSQIQHGTQYSDMEVYKWKKCISINVRCTEFFFLLCLRDCIHNELNYSLNRIHVWFYNKFAFYSMETRRFTRREREMISLMVLHIHIGGIASTAALNHSFINHMRFVCLLSLSSTLSRCSQFLQTYLIHIYHLWNFSI